MKPGEICEAIDVPYHHGVDAVLFHELFKAFNSLLVYSFFHGIKSVTNGKGI
jgi:hypothetical protein